MNDQEQKVLADFESLKEHLHNWGRFVDLELMAILKQDFVDTNILKIPPGYRLKTDRSYLFKALYRKKEYESPLKNIEDKVGTRLVLLKSDDIGKAAQLIVKHDKWDSKVTKNIRDEIEDKPRLFDYQSMHIVVQPKRDTGWEEKIIPMLTCEIQIRTLLQHAFAEVSHDSAYKGPYQNDKEIIRHLAKSMALMEATDDYFLTIFTLMSDQERYFANYISELVRIFKDFRPDFDRSDILFDMTDKLFLLLDGRSIDIPEIEAFIQKRKSDIRGAFDPKNGLLFTQPISILVSYLHWNHQSYLRENWPLSQEALKAVYKAFNTSFEHY